VQRVIEIQRRRSAADLESTRARVESARFHEEYARKCKAVQGRALRSRALAAESLRQMSECTAPEEYSAIQDRWREAQEASRALQVGKCSRIGLQNSQRRKRAMRLRRRNLADAMSRGRGHGAGSSSRARSSSSSSGKSSCSEASLLRAASDSEAEAMEEVAGLVGASDARSLAALGGEDLPRGRAGFGYNSSEESSGGSDFDGRPKVVPAARRTKSGPSDKVAAVLRQLKREPTDPTECAAKFALYEGYVSEVEAMRNTLLDLYEQSLPALPPVLVADMKRKIRGIDEDAALRIPDQSKEWFVYHMMFQAQANNMKMASLLDGYEKRLKYAVACDQAECPICMDVFGSGPCAPETLGCCHKVCAACWRHWKAVMRGRSFCPLCRHQEFLTTVATRASPIAGIPNVLYTHSSSSASSSSSSANTDDAESSFASVTAEQQPLAHDSALQGGRSYRLAL